MASSSVVWLQRYKLVFWDFDGVIKESVDVKADAFRELFIPWGTSVADRVVAHHLANGGLPRREKIEHALRQFVGVAPQPNEINALSETFGLLVRQKVVDAAWVPGAQALLRENPYSQTFILLTATPQQEIEWILDQLGIVSAFKAVFGAPARKADGMRLTLTRFGLGAAEAVFIGDSINDLDAAVACGVTFALRETALAARQCAGHTGIRIHDFS
jgi:phosphoglycolate phosphatase-like HAD superfamily hydrolase